LDFNEDMNDIETIREKAVPIEDASDVVGDILELVGNADFVLLGEASHGTREFYEYRAAITKRLIEEREFAAVAVEADFPDAYRVNRFVRGGGGDANAVEALGDFTRFPLWMWRNAVMPEFIEWLRDHNDKLAKAERIGFYGIDLYSLHASIRAVLEYLEKTDRPAAERARYRYSCFDHYGDDPQHYGYAASFDVSKSCEDVVVGQLTELRKRAFEYMNRDGFVARDEYFYAEQNARLVRNAEEYYREMFRGRVSSWNLRDRHMTETLQALQTHLEDEGRPPKIVVWAHNSHLGDARATEMGNRGEWNVGQLIKERFLADAVNIGFTTYEGYVTAAGNWDEPAQLKKVNRGMEGSVEKLFHETGIPNFFLDLNKTGVRRVLDRSLLERAIGVIYRPETERQSHYFHAHLPEQFDGVIHFDKTHAVRPLDKAASWTHEDFPETYPEGV
jgi:erythromycin esterase-like protein